MVHGCSDYVKSYSNHGLLTEEAFYMMWTKGRYVPLTTQDEVLIDALVYITPRVGPIFKDCHYLFKASAAGFAEARDSAIRDALGRHPDCHLTQEEMETISAGVYRYVCCCERHRINTLFRRNTVMRVRLKAQASACGYNGDLDKVIERIEPSTDDEWSDVYLLSIIEGVMRHTEE